MVCRAPPGLSPAHVIGSAVPHCAAHEASLRLTSRADRGGCVIAALGGELGITSAPALRDQLRSLLSAASQVIIDLSAVERADASGLAVLVGSGRRARLLGGSLRLAAPSPEVARVLSATGLNQHLDIFPTVRAAITGQPRPPDAIFSPAIVPSRGRIGAVIAGAAAQSAMPAIDLADGPLLGVVVRSGADRLGCGGERQSRVHLGDGGPDGGTVLPVSLPHVLLGSRREFLGLAVVI
jgi:anti-anti-sigma factor